MQDFPSDASPTTQIGVVIPCYKVTRHILEVLSGIGHEVTQIYVVDDCCPDKSGAFVESRNTDPRVRVLYNPYNMGVGGAVITGYRQAIADGVEIVIKVDGDGQMDPRLIPAFIAPILRGEADYTKGNRFYDLRNIHEMPAMRIFGNACLSFLSKISTGYWDLFDPTNGYTAIHTAVANHLPLDKISRLYFFETDILFRLNTLRAVVVDIPMDARYGDEESHLKIGKILPEFLCKHCRNTAKRIFYNYYLRDLSVASFELPLGAGLLGFGTFVGVYSWLRALETNIQTPTGTIMLAVLPIILGFNLLLSFIGYDIGSVPQRSMHQRLKHNGQHR